MSSTKLCQIGITCLKQSSNIIFCSVTSCSLNSVALVTVFINKTQSENRILNNIENKKL